MGPENEDPRREPEPLTGRYSYTQDPDGNPVTITITVTQKDPELQAIEATLVLLHMLPYDTRVRALTYIRDRIESDPKVWGTTPTSPELTAAERQKIALAIAGVDAPTWNLLPTEDQENYCLRAEAMFYGNGIRATGA